MLFDKSLSGFFSGNRFHLLIIALIYLMMDGDGQFKNLISTILNYKFNENLFN